MMSNECLIYGEDIRSIKNWDYSDIAIKTCVLLGYNFDIGSGLKIVDISIEHVLY